MRSISFRVATQYLAEKALAGGVVSGDSLALIKRSLHTILTTKIKIAVSLLLAAGFLGTGAKVFVAADAAPTGATVAQAAEADAKSPGDSAKSNRVDAFGDPLPPGAISRLGTLRWRHHSPVLFVAYLTDCKQVFTACEDGSLRVWEADTGRQIRKFGKKTGNVPDVRPGIACALSADGTTAAFGSPDGSITLCDVTAGKELKTFKSNPPFRASMIVFALNGKSLFAGHNDVIHQFDVAEGKELKRFGTQPPPGKRFELLNRRLAVSQDGKTLLAVGSERTNFEKSQFSGYLRSWDIATGKEQVVWGPQIPRLHCAAVANDGKTVAFGVYTGAIYLWDMAAGKEVANLAGQPNNIALMMTFSGDGKTLAVRTQDETVRLWSVAEGKVRLTLSEAPKGMESVDRLIPFLGVEQSNLAFSPDNKLLAAGTGARTVRQWDTGTGKEFAVPSEELQRGVVTIALLPDGKTVVTLSGNTLRLWEAEVGRESKRYDLPAGIHQAALTANGKTMALGTHDKIIIWDVLNARELTQWKVGFGDIATLGISPDGKAVAVRSYGQKIKLWEVANARELWSADDALKLDDSPFSLGEVQVGTKNLVFSPDGTQLVRLANPSFREDLKTPPTRLRLCDVATGKEVSKFDPPKGDGIWDFAFSPDGRTIATSNVNSVSLWESASGKKRASITFKPLGQVAADFFPIRRLAFSPDGKLLAVATSEGVVRFWDMTAGKERDVLRGHQGDIVSLAFAQNGKRLATGSNDTTALIWGVPAGSVPPSVQVEAKQAELLWEDLINADAAKAYQAIRVLSQVPKHAVPLLKERVQAVPSPDADKVAHLIADLDSNAFATRKKAEDELEKMGRLAQDALEKALKNNPSLEVQKRLEALLAKLVTVPSPNPQELRTLRALEVLETAGTPEAQEVLKAVAKGASRARVTKDAQAALDRLGKR